MTRGATLTLMLTLAALAGCAKPAKTDYSRYLERMPRSIVVLPPLNESTQVRAPEAFMSTITVPLAERGYYVYPVAMVHGYMRENGLPTSGEMHQVPPQRFHDILGADAVLYITIKEWTDRYVVLNSTTSVTLEYRLVDAVTGQRLWERTQTVADSSGNGGSGGGIGGMLIGAAVGAAIHAASDVDAHREQQLARQANYVVIDDMTNGMLIGPRHPKYDEEQQKHRNELGTVAPAEAKTPPPR
jgi:hypothetical protein